MALRSRRRFRLLVVTLSSVLALLFAGLGFAWLGVYNVGASRGHWFVTDWLLRFVMYNSVVTHSLAVETPPLDGHDLIRLGAAHFHTECAYCHGAPGSPIGPVATRMLPPPPDLSTLANQWKDRELFWIVKHGIKYTGMPAWVSLQRDDEVWAVIAFLKRLPTLDVASYRDLAMGDVTVVPEGGRALALGKSSEDAITACARCHGADERGPRSNLVPVLHGQPVEFLTDALQAFAKGWRESGIMQPIAAELAPDAMQRVATYYAQLKPPARPSPDAADVENGRRIATQGLPDAGIPPCLACHGQASSEKYPRLAGQHAAYMKGQLRLWRSGLMPRSETAAIMAPIARRLDERQIEEVSAYFERLSDPSSDGTKPP
jgi:cytochrome c553